jgi:hypothetical protein
MSFQEDKATTMVILNLVAMLMFVVLPIVWFMVIGWAGLSLNRTLDAFKDVTGSIQNGADNTAKIGDQTAMRGTGKFLK